MPTLAYSFSRYNASAQKCGGAQQKMIRNSSKASGDTWPVTAVQPSTGGIAPAAPPMTMFCGVARLRNTVYTTAYPTMEAKVSTAVRVFTQIARISIDAIDSMQAKIIAWMALRWPVGSG